MTEPMRIDLPPEALKALEKDGAVVLPKTVHPSVQKAVLESLAFKMFGPKMKPTFKHRCMLYVSFLALNMGRR